MQSLHMHADGKRVLAASVGWTSLRWISIDDQPREGWHLVTQSEYESHIARIAELIGVNRAVHAVDRVAESTRLRHRLVHRLTRSIRKRLQLAEMSGLPKP